MKCAFILEDDPGNSQVMRKFMEHYGIPEIVAFGDVASAEGALSDELIGRCDLWVIDNLLPDGSSERFVKALRARGARNLCLYTASDPGSPIDAPETSAFDVVLEKPLRYSTFRAELDRLSGSSDLDS